MNKKKSLLEQIWYWLPWIWLIAGYVLMIWYQVVPGKWLVDSDMAAEMVLANLLNEEGGLLSHNWYYSTELRVMQTPQILRLGLVLFPNNWHMARVAAMAFLNALFIAGYLFMMKQAGFERAGVWTAAALIWPCGQWYLFLLLYSGFHVTYVIFGCFIVGFIFKLSRNKLEKTEMIISAIMLALLSLFSGLNGVRVTMMYFAPICCAMLIILVLELHKSGCETLQAACKKCATEMKTFGWIIFATVFDLAGYLFNYIVLSQKYDYVAYNEMKWEHGFSIGRMIDVWSDFLSLFGYTEDVKLFGFNGIATFCGVLMAGFIIFCIVRLFQRYNSLDLWKKLLFMMFICGLFISALVFAFMTEYSVDYWLPIYPFVFAVFQIEGETERNEIRLKLFRKVALLAFVAVISITSIGTIRHELTYPIRGQKGLTEVVQVLQDNGYTKGYASFWSAQVLTEMTSGEIEVWTVNGVNDGEVYKWLQEKSHVTEVPEGPVFLILNRVWDSNLHENPIALSGQGTILLDNDEFWVVGFDSAEEIQALWDTYED